jgi:sugar-phosphatase
LPKTFLKQAVLFDLDGVLVDSRASVERQWRRWAEVHGLDAEQVLAVAHGRRTIETIQVFAPNLDAVAEADEMERRESADYRGVVVMPTAREILTSLPPDGWAIATSGGRVLATTRLSHVGLPIPRVLVTADDVPRGKPDPLPYLTAAHELGVPAQDCIVLEDSPAGISAGKAAGAEVIGVATTYEIHDIKHADVLVEHIGKLRFASQDRRIRVDVVEEIRIE